VGLAIWVAEVGNQKKPSTQDSAAGVRNSDGGQPAALPSGRVWRRRGTSGADIELCTMDSNDDPGALLISEDKLMEECLVVQAMARDCVKVHPTATVKETLGAVVAARQDCALVVDENGLLEGILTPSDLQGKVLQATEEFVSSEEASNVEVESTLVAAICTGKGENQGIGTNLVVCYPDMNLQMAKDLMVQHGFRQLPVVTRKGTQWQYHKLVGLLDDDGITRCVKCVYSPFPDLMCLGVMRSRDEQSCSSSSKFTYLVDFSVFTCIINPLEKSCLMMLHLAENWVPKLCPSF
jgi:CBS domain-containing protein